jgi:hypothetical protein
MQKAGSRHRQLALPIAAESASSPTGLDSRQARALIRRCGYKGSSNDVACASVASRHDCVTGVTPALIEANLGKAGHSLPAVPARFRHDTDVHAKGGSVALAAAALDPFTCFRCCCLQHAEADRGAAFH